MTIQIMGGAVYLTRGLRLELARRAAGYTQAQLAEAVEVSTSTVRRAETEGSGVRRPLMAAWAMATGVSLRWLETGEAPADDPDEGLAVRHQGLEPRTRWYGSFRPDQQRSALRVA